MVNSDLADHCSQKDIASTQLAKDIVVTQKTEWFMLHSLRHASQTASFNRPLERKVRWTRLSSVATKRTSTRGGAPVVSKVALARSPFSECWNEKASLARVLRCTQFATSV